MPRTAKVDQAARAKARARRIALDKDRAARDARIETNAAAVFTASATRTTAEAAMGVALRSLLADDLTATQIADLCELTVAHVHKLIKGTPTLEPAPALRQQPAVEESQA